MHDIKAESNESDLVRFYSNKNVLVTGATGFFGKMLVQKLLRECPNVGDFYLIVRPKTGKDVRDRMEEVYKDPVFGKLKEKLPDFRKKIHLIEGDISKVNMALKPEDRNTIIDNVNIVFHAAASLSMVSKLKESINTNVRGSREMIILCQQIKNLKSAVFISTAYSNCHNFTIEESFYDPPITANTLMKMADELDERVLESITEGLVDKMPNTYIFTKCIAEDVIRKLGGNLPLAVYRPSIVFTSVSDPLPGWIDNIYGPAGVAVATGMGIMRVFYCDDTKSGDLVPIDYCINGLIACAWDLTNHQKHIGCELPVYNYSAGLKYSKNWGQFKEGTMKNYKYPPSKAMWVTRSFLISDPYVYWLLVILLHYIPAIIVDTGLLITGQKRMMLKLYAKVHTFSNVLRFFTTNEFNIINRNVLDMWNRLDKKDQSIFPFDVRTINWDRVYQDSTVGLKYYIIKDKPEDLPKDIARYKKLETMHKVLLVALGIVAAWILYKLIMLVL